MLHSEGKNDAAPENLGEGVRLWAGYLGREDQIALVDLIRSALVQAPLFVPKMPRTGKEMSVRMTNFGPLGWVTDKENGYRYQAQHPVTGAQWPEIPPMLLKLWEDLSGYPHPPEACLVNFYDDDAKMGLHQDRDEQDFEAPVVSISLGNDCRFRIGGVKRGGKTKSLVLRSGDVIAFGGPARLIYHGVDKIYPDTSALLAKGGRLNLTLRRVSSPG